MQLIALVGGNHLPQGDALEQRLRAWDDIAISKHDALQRVSADPNAVRAIEAVSGQDLFDKRSNTVRLLNNLATAVVSAGEPVWYTGDTSNMAPQVEEAVQEYVDESHSKTVAVLPLARAPKEETDDPTEKAEMASEGPIGALVVELIEDSRVPAKMRQRVDVVAQHSATALANALECDAVWGKVLLLGGGPTCQTTYGEYLGTMLTAMGIGPLPNEAFTTAEYCTDWLDTEESQRLLQYQRASCDDIVNEVRDLAERGYVEVTLLGQNVNAYGVEFGDRAAFAKLLRACGSVEGLERVRFTSPHPADFTDDVIAAMAETPNVMPSLHMPLQSGRDRLLQAMRPPSPTERSPGITHPLRADVPIYLGAEGPKNVALAAEIPALRDAVVALVGDDERPGVVASAVELVLEGLHLSKRLNKDADHTSTRATYRSR